MAKKYYAYLLVNGNVKGIAENWEECKTIVSGTQARYKGFTSREDADNWLNEGASYEVKQEGVKAKKNTEIIPGIYFDAGKRGKHGITFTRVTNEKAEDMLCDMFSSQKYFQKTINCINLLEAKKTISVYNGCRGIALNVATTNNLGELLGFIAATELALQELELEDKKHIILGDSKLVLDYWSKGNYKFALPSRTKNAIKIAIELRAKAEALGIQYRHISGDVNPADLGFHK